MADVQPLIAERQERIRQLEAELAQQRVQLHALEKRKRRSVLGGGAANTSTRVALGRGLKSLISASKDLAGHTGSAGEHGSAAGSGSAATGSVGDGHHGDESTGSSGGAASSVALSSTGSSANMTAAVAAAVMQAGAISASPSQTSSDGSDGTNRKTQIDLNTCQVRRQQVINTLSEVREHGWADQLRKREAQLDAKRRRELREKHRGDRGSQQTDRARSRRRERRERKKERRQEQAQQQREELSTPNGANTSSTPSSTGDSSSDGYLVPHDLTQQSLVDKERERKRLQQMAMMNPLAGSVVELPRKDRAQSLATPSHGRDGALSSSSSGEDFSSSDSDSESDSDLSDRRSGPLGSTGLSHQRTDSDLPHVELDAELTDENSYMSPLIRRRYEHALKRIGSEESKLTTREAYALVDFTGSDSEGESELNSNNHDPLFDSYSAVPMFQKTKSTNKESKEVRAPLNSLSVPSSKYTERVPSPSYLEAETEFSKAEFEGTDSSESDPEWEMGDHTFPLPGAAHGDDGSAEELSDKDDPELSEASNWNHRFQKCITKMQADADYNNELPLEEKVSMNVELLHLSQDFIHAAATYGKIIISEVYLPNKKKTIKPVTIGGQAGGDKYVINNILYKFALDSHNLFQGSDYAAAKVAGAELKGLISYFSLEDPDLCLPLMALVDYRGFRLIAMSVLPLSAGSHIYGSRDAGRTVLASDKHFNKIMRTAGRRLNLKPHYCGMFKGETKRLYSCADIEGHKAEDGRFYLLDFSRTLPPVKPEPRHWNGHLYRLFRQEFVVNYHTRLCSDGFSGFIINDPAMKEHNAELEAATTYLTTTLVKRFAKEFMYIVLEADAEKFGAAPEPGSESNPDRQVYKLSSISLPEEMHRCGINMRYLGVLCGHLYDLGSKAANCVRLVLVEAASRCMKNTLNRDLRSKMRQLRLPLDVPYRQLVVDYLNLVFGSHQRSYDYWNKEMSEQMVNYLSFDPNHLTSDPFAQSSSISLQARVFFEPEANQAREFNGRYLVVNRLQSMTGIRLTRHCLSQLRVGRNIMYLKGEPFAMLDLEAVCERVKHMNIVANAEGLFFQHKGMEMELKSNLKPAIAMYKLAISKYEEALSSCPTNASILRNCALARFKLLDLNAKVANQQFFSGKDMSVVRTDHYFLRALDAEEKRKVDPRTLCSYAQFLLRCNRHDRAEDFFLRCLEHAPDYAYGLLSYANFLTSNGSTDLGKIFLSAWQDVTQESVSNTRTDSTDGEERQQHKRLFSPITGKDLSGIIRVYYESGSYRTLRVLATTTVFEVKEQLIDHLLVQLRASLTRAQSLHIIGRHQQYALFRVDKNVEKPMYTALADDDNPWLYFQSETRSGDAQQEGVLYFLNPSDIPAGQLAWPAAAGKRRSSFKRSLHAARVKSLNQLAAIDARDKMAAVGGGKSSSSRIAKLQTTTELKSQPGAGSGSESGPSTDPEVEGEESSPRFLLQTSSGPIPITEDATVNTEENVRTTVSMSLATLDAFYNALHALQGFQPFVSSLPPHVEKGLLPIQETLHIELDKFFRKQTKLSKLVRGRSSHSRLLWVASCVLEMYRMVYLIYGVLRVTCLCSSMEASPSVFYRWPGKNGPEMLPAHEYVDQMKHWMEELFQDKKHFPVDLTKMKSKLVIPIFKQICKRLLRLFSHMYFRHHPVIQTMGLSRHFVIAYSFCVHVCLAHKLLSKKLDASTLCANEDLCELLEDEIGQRCSQTTKKDKRKK